MSGPRAIPDEARARQIRASDPTSSVFVSANAGSGKTHVLVQRVIRLMLTGVPPEKVLCITFTKAAAANMAERVFTTLGHWITLDDSALDAAIRDTGITRTDVGMRRRARELFACALETPGGLKVQTIHALCTRLLQQFPFEANVPARFAVMDDRDQAEMMQRASLAVLLDAAASPDSAAGRALATAMTLAADVTFQDVVRQASLSRDRVLAWVERAGSVDHATAELSQTLGIDPADTVEAIARAIVDGPYLPRASWTRAADVLESGTVTDGKQGMKLRAALDLSGEAQIDEYLSVFFTDKMEPRKSLVTKSLATREPRLSQKLSSESERIGPLLEARRAVAMRDRTEALLTIATAVAANYRREKQERGLLDYDDLIDKTLNMLDSGAAGWVHYKLDRGVDHVLIDEAQDTSPRQWDIVAHLIAEFSSGEGARDGIKRTIFAVGDEKQSIFSFQGAVPREFGLRREALKRQFEGAGLAFDPVSFTYSFRSGDAILQSVDHVFRDEPIFRSIHADGAPPLHQSLADAGPSLIELWALQEPDARPEIEGWDAPFDAVSETSPEVRLADRVQTEIKRLMADGVETGPIGRRRLLSHGDVLVLVRRRGKAFDAVIQALKHAGIPVAGADRLRLTEHIAVIDLMSLADALLLPQDDLALAVVLKSPLFGLTEDDLFALAYDRRGSLRAQLPRHAASNVRIKAALARLERCERRAFADTPFAFYAWLLGGDGGRARILRRLGHEANDALDEFLELALGYERRAPASLQGFMAWLRAADTEVKRDMDIARDEVRVMTVHGAKGLEAPVVFLVDTATSSTDTARLNLIHVPQTPGSQGNGASNVAVWAGRKADDPPAVAAARAAMLTETEDEYRRLLYVAMTRAADRLIVGGCKPGNRNEVREHSWYDLIDKGLTNSGLHMQDVSPDGAVKRYSRNDDPGVAAMSNAAPVTARTAPVLPVWLRVPVSPVAPSESVLRPSDDGTGYTPRGDAGDLRAHARRRGVLVHRLLQSLPDCDASRRRDVALRYLARNAAQWSNAEREALADQLLAVIVDARFADVFASGSRAEVPIVGKIARAGRPPALVSGQIDRLVVTPDHILIVDYKTNLGPPTDPADAPATYVRQLALYRAVLAKLYPDRPVKATLLWTETPEMMEIPAGTLNAALASVISP